MRQRLRFLSLHLHMHYAYMPILGIIVVLCLNFFLTLFSLFYFSCIWFIVTVCYLLLKTVFEIGVIKLSLSVYWFSYLMAFLPDRCVLVPPLLVSLVFHFNNLLTVGSVGGSAVVRSVIGKELWCLIVYKLASAPWRDKPLCGTSGHRNRAHLVYWTLTV